MLTRRTVFEVILLSVENKISGNDDDENEISIFIQ